MEFPFTTNKQYFQRDELKNINKFIALNVEPKDVWYSAVGEARHVVRVALPQGCVTDLTVYSDPLADGSKRYHTPIATVEGPTGLIDWRHPDETKTTRCTTDEWMAWCGDTYQINHYEAPQISPAEAKKNKAQVAMLKRSAPETEKGDDFTKAGKWTRTVGMKEKS